MIFDCGYMYIIVNFPAQKLLDLFLDNFVNKLTFCSLNQCIIIIIIATKDTKEFYNPKNSYKTYLWNGTIFSELKENFSRGL